MSMILAGIKTFLPNRPTKVQVWRGPFRGACLMMNPRSSLRKIFGVYEHELNGWLESALTQFNRVIDVGANDGYFTFGCAAAFRRLDKSGEIVAFEPQEQHMITLEQSLKAQPSGRAKIILIQSLVGREAEGGMTTLDALHRKLGEPEDSAGAIIKIDVEGAELDVLDGGLSWLNSKNSFLIEVHKESYLGRISRIFAERGLVLDRVEHRPLPLIGGEARDDENWWLVSRLA